jgi:hypothetical protein
MRRRFDVDAMRGELGESDRHRVGLNHEVAEPAAGRGCGSIGIMDELDGDELVARQLDHGQVPHARTRDTRRGRRMCIAATKCSVDPELRDARTPTRQARDITGSGCTKEDCSVFTLLCAFHWGREAHRLTLGRQHGKTDGSRGAQPPSRTRASPRAPTAGVVQPLIG